VEDQQEDGSITYYSLLLLLLL